MKKILIVLFLLAFLVTGCGLQDAPFFAGVTAEQLVIYAVTFLIAISQALFPKISIMQYLKVWLPWLKDELAYYFVRTSLFGLSFLALYLTGEFTSFANMDLMAVIAFYGVLATLSEGAYQRLKNSGRSLRPA